MKTILRRLRDILPLMLLLLALAAAPVSAQEEEPVTARPLIFVRSSHTEPGIITPGGVVELFVELHNVGSAGAVDILVSFAGEGFVPEGSSSIKNLPGLQPNEHGTVSQRFRAASTLAGGVYAVSVQLNYRGALGSGAEGVSFSSSETVGVNVLTATPTPQVKAGKPKLVIEQVVTEPAMPQPGEPFTLTLTLQNVGTGAARNVLLVTKSAATSSAPDFAPLNGGNVVAVGSIGWQERKQASIRLVSDRAAKTGLRVLAIGLEYENVAGEGVESEQNITLELSPVAGETAPRQPLVVIEAYQLEPPRLSPGQPFSLTLQVRNVGGAAARQITLEFSSSSTSQTSSIDIAPLGTGNVRFLPALAAGEVTQVLSPFIISGASASGVYLTKVNIAYFGEKDEKLERTEQISLQVVAAPRLQLNFYRDVGLVFSGQPVELPIEVFNVGRARLNSTTAEVLSADLEIQTAGQYLGPIDTGTSVTLDAQAIASTPGEAQITVRVHYIDDFNQPQYYDGDLTFMVEEALPPEPGEPEPGGEVIPERPARPWLVRLFRGLLGLGSAP